jgi:amino acid transporter
MHASVLFIVFPVFTLAGSWLSMGLGGEVKRVRRTQLIGILGALALTAAVVAIYDPLATHALGDTFQGAIAYNSLNHIAGGSTEGTLGAAPYLSVLVGILAGNIPLAVLILATFAVWVWLWPPILFAYSSRSMIAWSFDRIAPDKLGYVSERFHTPVVSIWTCTGLAAVYLYLIEYHHLALLTMTEVTWAVFMAAMFAAIIFPFRRPAMYAASPVSRLRIFGMPAMSLAGAVGFGVFGLAVYLLWNDPVAAGPLIKSPLPLEFWIVVGTAVVGALWYAGVKAYRRRSGIDIRLAFQQIPIE